MKKTISLILITMIMITGLTGCKSIKAHKEPMNATQTDATSEVPTAVGTSIEYVTDENGEQVTDENGEQVTIMHYVDVTVSNDTTAEITTETSQTEAAAPETTAAPAETTVPATTAQATTAPTGNSTPATTEPATQPANNSIPENSEYEIMRSGNFYAVGYVVDSDNIKMPMEMAITKDTMYMTYSSSNRNMVALIDAKNDVYLILPDEKEYLHITSSLLNIMGSSTEDLLGNSVDFSQMPGLSEYSEIKDTEMNGKSCKEYTLPSESGCKKIYLDGNTMIAYASYDNSGKLSQLFVIDKITGDVPAEKTTPPSGYKAYKDLVGMFSFMNKYADIFEEEE